MKVKEVKKLEFQLASLSVEENSVILEFIDDNDNELIQINIDKNNVHHVILYSLSENITFPLSELEKGIEIAKREVKNIDFDKYNRGTGTK